MAFRGFKGFFKGFVKKSSATFSTFSQNVGVPKRPAFNQQFATLESYIQNVIAYACITLVAEQAATVPFDVFVGKKKQENHPLLDRLNNPNPQEAKDFFFEKIYSYWQINGNSFVEAAYSDRSPDFNPTPPDWLYSLRPDKIAIIPGKNFIPEFYQFDNQGHRVRFNVTVLGKSNLLHLKKFHPLDDYFGLSPLNPAAWGVTQYNNASRWNSNLLGDSAQPTGNLMVPGNLTPEQREVLQQALDEKFSGPHAARRAMILEGGMTWQENSLSPRDMDFLKLKKNAGSEISIAWGVPFILLGLEQGKFENLQVANEQLWMNTVLPLVRNLVAEFNMWLSPRYGKDVKIVPDLSKIMVLVNRLNRQLDSLEKITFMTPNEKREKVGLEPLDGGDDLFVELNKVPISAVSSNFPPITENKASLSQHLNKKYGYSEDQTKKIIKLVNQ